MLLILFVGDLWPTRETMSCHFVRLSLQQLLNDILFHLLILLCYCHYIKVAYFAIRLRDRRDVVQSLDVEVEHVELYL